jgi:hypothetical protein
VRHPAKKNGTRGCRFQGWNGLLLGGVRLGRVLGRLGRRLGRFGGRRGGRGLRAAAGAAAWANSANGMVLPPLTTARGSILPAFIVKIVISASLRSPLSSKAILPVAPLYSIFASSGRYLAGSGELAFLIASISSFAAS